MELSNAYDQQLLDELHWRVEREREAQEIERLKKLEADSKAQLNEGHKETVHVLQSSKLRCICYDYVHWRDSGCVDAQIACHVRDSGHNIPHCELSGARGK